MVWRPENRARDDPRGQRYPSDLTNEEWRLVEPVLPVPQASDRPRRYPLRAIMSGIRYVLRYGVPWEAMPKDLPPSSICYDYWRVLSDGDHMQRINHELVMLDREKAGREPSPTLAIVDAQTVKCDAPHGERVYDAGKENQWAKAPYRGGQRWTPACGKDHVGQCAGPDRWDTAGQTARAVMALDRDSRRGRRIQGHIHRRRKGMAGRIGQVVKRPDFAKGFVILPKRWKVEQSIGALTILRRLKTDYESLIHVSAAAMLFASITRLLASITMG